MAYMRLGDLLLAAGTIDETQLEQALEEQKESGLRLGDALIRSGVITEAQLIEALQMQLGIEFVDLTVLTLPAELAALVPRSIARKHTVVPVKLVHGELHVAMADPLNFVALEEIRMASRKRVVPMIATRRAAEHAIATLYGNEGAASAIEEMKQEAGITGENPAVSGAEDPASATPTIRFVNSVIERAVGERASDIHLEPQEGEMLVRMRIDGQLHRILSVPAGLHSTVISRLKVMGGMNISEHTRPQDGRALVRSRGRDIDLRISSLPTVHGEKLVIRVLDKSAGVMSKQELGLEGDDLAKFEALLRNSNGVVLIVGPTGSGKSTTMFTILSDLSREEVNVVTLEDPVEYHIPGVSQVQINEKAGLTFAGGLRSILRQDPDIISVGEIRDGETGSIAMRAAITGHQVFSTLHTNDAVEAVSRLQDIGVERYLTASALRGVISQRLIRRLCPHCREPYRPAAEELRELGIREDSGLTFYRGKGCRECFHTGYYGRRAVFEILMITERLRQLISSGADSDALTREALDGGFVPMREACAKLVREGMTSVAEARRVIHTTVV